MRRYLILALFLLAACGGPPPQPVTMDGRDSTGAIIDPINLWDDYRARTRVTGHAHDGEQVSLLRRDGNGCEVRTTAGERGWVTCGNFIKEFK